MFIFLNSQKEYYKWTDDDCKLKGVDFHQEGKSKKKKSSTYSKMLPLVTLYSWIQRCSYFILEPFEHGLHDRKTNSQPFISIIFNQVFNNITDMC